MSLKIISFIFVISLAFGINNSNQVKNVPFDVNEVIRKINHHQQVESRIPNPEFQPFDQGEFLIDTNVVYAPAPTPQYSPSVAFDGTDYLVVWADTRSGFDIYGARVNQAGTVLDPEGIAISTHDNSQYSPSVAFDGTNYLVIWADGRNGLSDIYGARVNQAGNVFDPTGIPISIADYDQSSPAITFDGTNYLVVWEDDRNSFFDPDIYGTLVSQTGIVLNPAGIPISMAVNNQSFPAIAFDGTNYLVVWEDWRNNPGTSDIYGARVSQAGTVLDTNGITISMATADQLSPTITFDSTNYLVVWEDWRNNPDTSDIYGTRISQAGTVLDSNGIVISSAANGQFDPNIAFDGTNYLVVWGDGRNGTYNSDIYGTRVNQAGTVLDPEGIAISTHDNSQYSPSVTFDGTNYLVVWQDARGTNDDIYGARVSQTGTVLDPDGITISTIIVIYDQFHPAVAFDGINYLVVWQDGRNGLANTDIYGARVNQAGIVLDPEGIAISTHDNSQYFPSVAFDGTNYLVVWADTRSGFDIYGARVNQAGTVLDPGGIAISTSDLSQDSPSVAFDGTNYLVVWYDFRNYNYDRELIT
jgi:hypothetical protein